MKNTSNKKYVIFASALFALVVAFVMAAFPAQAEANYGYHQPTPITYCSYPLIASVAHNGYFYCTFPTQTPSYSQPQYPVTPPPPQYPQLSASCYASRTSATTGSQIQWTATAYGGTGSYTYNWSGTDNLYGTGQTIQRVYYSLGHKTASVSVYSGGQATTVQCSNSVNIYEAYYQQPYSYPVAVPVPQYIQQPVYGGSTNAGLDIGCYADPVNASIDQPITWNAEVSGGIAPYTYSWSGSDGLSGNQSSVIKYYSTNGEKSAIVSVTSADGKTGTRACSNSLAIRNLTPTAPRVATPAPAVSDSSSNLTAASLFSLNNVPWGWVAILVILVLFGIIFYMLFNKAKM